MTDQHNIDDILFDGIKMPDDPVLAEEVRQRIRALYAEYRRTAITILERHIYTTGTGASLGLLELFSED